MGDFQVFKVLVITTDVAAPAVTLRLPPATQINAEHGIAMTDILLGHRGIKAGVHNGAVQQQYHATGCLAIRRQPPLPEQQQLIVIAGFQYPLFLRTGSGVIAERSRRYGWIEVAGASHQKQQRNQ